MHLVFLRDKRSEERDCQSFEILKGNFASGPSQLLLRVTNFAIQYWLKVPTHLSGYYVESDNDGFTLQSGGRITFQGCPLAPGPMFRFLNVQMRTAYPYL